MTKYYVAGKADDYENVRKLIEEIKALGGDITYDWTHLTCSSVEPIYDWYRKTALLDLEGIDKCDVVVALMTKEYIFRGTWVELGYAIAKNKKIVIIGYDNAMRCNFSAHPNVIILNSTDDLKKWIK